LDDGVGIDAALEEARTAGLRTPEYVDKARDYIRRTQASEAQNGAGDDNASKL
jgi:hypothetical protein